jgi:uncharacterized protein YukE
LAGASQVVIVSVMPSWTPNWNPVVIDEVGLLDAIADCAAAIASIEEGRSALAPFLLRARDQWEGPARIDFDDDYSSFERQIEAVIAELRQASRGFEREIAEAHEEQARRWAQQELWRQEKAVEDAVAIAEREAGRRPAIGHDTADAFRVGADSPGDGDLI